MGTKSSHETLLGRAGYYRPPSSDRAGMEIKANAVIESVCNSIVFSRTGVSVLINAG